MYTYLTKTKILSILGTGYFLKMAKNSSQRETKPICLHKNDFFLFVANEIIDSLTKRYINYLKNILMTKSNNVTAGMFSKTNDKMEVSESFIMCSHTSIQRRPNRLAKCVRNQRSFSYITISNCRVKKIVRYVEGFVYLLGFNLYLQGFKLIPTGV